jgi:hypothetical protein
MTYYQKKDYVVAWQYDGQGLVNMPKWLKDFMGRRRFDLNPRYDKTIIIVNDVPVEEGEWITLDDAENFIKYDDDEFNSLFEVVKNG